MADKEPSKPARELASQIEQDGGQVLALYQEPVGDHWQIFCLLPRTKCEASAYQRDLSPTHVKRLTASMKRLDRFVDPIVAISPRPGVYWTPNGNHRRAVLDKLKADVIPVILVVEPEMLFEVLPLNVEKAHNLKEKSLEVIRMYRALVKDDPETTEEKWASQFESPHFITLGLLYEENKRFAGGAFAPILRRVDKFLKQTLPKGIESRTERADMVRAADAPHRLFLQSADVIAVKAMTAFAEGVVAARGKIDILVAGVGGFAGGSLVETDLETWKRMLDLNLTSAFSAAKAVLPSMVR